VPSTTSRPTPLTTTLCRVRGCRREWPGTRTVKTVRHRRTCSSN
jgi:hypothetical protein